MAKKELANKGLEALEEYKRNTCPFCQYHLENKCTNQYDCFIKIIEKELKEKEQQDILINVIKEVIEFGILEKVEQNEDGLTLTQQIGITTKREITKKEKELYRRFILNQCFPKELKALEIIKNKIKFKLSFYNSVLKEERYRAEMLEITKEDYDLLKEVLL